MKSKILFLSIILNIQIKSPKNNDNPATESNHVGSMFNFFSNAFSFFGATSSSEETKSIESASSTGEDKSPELENAESTSNTGEDKSSELENAESAKNTKEEKSPELKQIEIILSSLETALKNAFENIDNIINNSDLVNMKDLVQRTTIYNMLANHPNLLSNFKAFINEENFNTLDKETLSNLIQLSQQYPSLFKYQSLKLKNQETLNEELVKLTKEDYIKKQKEFIDTFNKEKDKVTELINTGEFKDLRKANYILGKLSDEYQSTAKFEIMYRTKMIEKMNEINEAIKLIEEMFLEPYNLSNLIIDQKKQAIMLRKINIYFKSTVEQLTKNHENKEEKHFIITEAKNYLKLLKLDLDITIFQEHAKKNNKEKEAQEIVSNFEKTSSKHNTFEGREEAKRSLYQEMENLKKEVAKEKEKKRIEKAKKIYGF